MTNKPSKLVDFVHKTLSVKPNAHWKAADYATLVGITSRYNTYAETVNSKGMPNADTLHYRIEQDTTVQTLQEAFQKLMEKQLKKLRRRKAIVIVDYTCEPFFGHTQSEWLHGYRSSNGSRGCYKILAASILAGKERYFVYAKPVPVIADETLELWQILAHLETLGIRIKVLLMDRGLAKNAENLALLETFHIKYLGLFPKYRNIKKIIKGMKHAYKNRKFSVKGVPTRLVIGKDVKRKFAWVFVTNLEENEFMTYLRLYKRRWNIETGFRVHDEARIRTKSINIRVRFFLFLVALVLYNMWKILGMPTPFKRFVIGQKWCVECVDRRPT